MALHRLGSILNHNKLVFMALLALLALVVSCGSSATSTPDAQPTSAPGATLERLGIRRENLIRLKLANGEVVEHAIGEVVAEMDGVRRTIICIFGPEGAQPLIGAHTLEAFLLAVDPVEQRLIPTEALWL